jgi:hypothetical protein
MAARLVELEGHGIALPDRHSRRHRDPCTKAVPSVRLPSLRRPVRSKQGPGQGLSSWPVSVASARPLPRSFLVKPSALHEEHYRQRHAEEELAPKQQRRFHKIV